MENYRYMQVEDFQRIRNLKKMTGFPDFWIAARYWNLIDNNIGKSDELLADILKGIELKERTVD